MVAKTLTEVIRQTLSSAGTFWEKEKSTRDLSVREMRTRGPHHIYHRFPLRDGITARDLIVENVSAHNPLLERLKRRGP